MFGVLSVALHPALFLHRTLRAVSNQDQKLAVPPLFIDRLNGPPD